MPGVLASRVRCGQSQGGGILVAGLGTDDTGIATAIGGAYVNAADWPASRTVKFRCVLESSSAVMPACAATADLYDTSNALGGGPAVVAGSQIDNSAAANPLVASMVEVDITAAFAGFAGAGVFEARLWINTAGGGNMVTCKSAQLVVE